MGFRNIQEKLENFSLATVITNIPYFKTYF